MAATVSTRITRLAAISPRTTATNLQTDLTIGDFRLGADYLRDAANSFGLASTVTAGDDVRFWAGDTFANRATAPFRLTEAGVLTAASITTAATTATWAGVSGAGKPADNATVGAIWGTNLSSIPANISTAGGSPSISLLNNAISLSAAGVLSGAGGGTIDLASLSGSVTTGQLTANIVAAVQGAFANLAAIKADLGSVTAGNIVVGTTNKIWLNDGADGVLAIGGTDKATAPFRVTAAGALTAASITTAQSTANTAVTNAATAQSTADAKLAKAGGDTLTGIIDLQVTTNYNAGIRVGNAAWNTTTGALDGVAGHNGVIMTRAGLLGVKDGAATFSIDAATGNAIFKGDITGASGTFAGNLSTTGYVYATGAYTSAPDGWYAAVHGYLTGAATQDHHGVVGYQNDASGVGSGVQGYAAGGGYGGFFGGGGSGGGVYATASAGTGYAIRAVGNASETAVYAYGGTGQYALELAGTGTALIPGLITASGGINVPTSAAGNTYSGTYTPTITNGTNVAASTPRVTSYSRIGDYVQVSGSVSIDPTTTGGTVFEISLPIASNFANYFDLGGTMGTIGTFGDIVAEATNNTAAFDYVAVSTANQVITFTFGYRII